MLRCRLRWTELRPPPRRRPFVTKTGPCSIHTDLLGQAVSVLSGTLIAESLKDDAVVDVQLTVLKISRRDVGDLDAGQPRTWTLIEFIGTDDQAPLLARSLEHALQAPGGWYCDFRTETETFVVFASATFRYPRGDEHGRSKAAAHARSVGVPPSQHDWPD